MERSDVVFPWFCFYDYEGTQLLGNELKRKIDDTKQ